MVFIDCCSKYFVVATKSRVIVFNFGDRGDNSKAEDPNGFELKLPELDASKSSINNVLRKEDNPVCGRFSNDSTLFVVADIYKRLIIWKTNDGALNNNGQSNGSNNDRSWEIKNILNTDKRVVQLCFFNDNSLLGKSL